MAATKGGADKKKFVLTVRRLPLLTPPPYFGLASDPDPRLELPAPVRVAILFLSLALTSDSSSDQLVIFSTGSPFATFFFFFGLASSLLAFSLIALCFPQLTAQIYINDAYCVVALLNNIGVSSSVARRAKRFLSFASLLVKVR